MNKFETAMQTARRVFGETEASLHVEQLVEEVFNGSGAKGFPQQAGSMLGIELRLFDTSHKRVVILGGGTGLSTVVGGNSQLPSWAEQPFVGLKQEFPELDVVVCTTDDGGSTGLLLQSLPMIGIGDLRKSCLSMILFDRLQQTYRMGERQTRDLVRAIQQVFNHRFQGGVGEMKILQDPLLAVEPALRAGCPHRLTKALSALGSYISRLEVPQVIRPAGHCLGNLILTAAVFRAAYAEGRKQPSMKDLRSGMDEVCRLIGVPPGRLHAATSTPGQLKFRYANGVEVYGQSKSSHVRRGLPVERLITEYVETPQVSASICRALKEADLIIYAPGSLYTSLMPVLQLEPIVQAIRANRKALKVLGANFWVQEGETDLSLRNDDGQGFRVSELIEAYDRNVPGGYRGLFDIVLSANLEHIPGNILRNYALEGKKPIHLDRSRVLAMGLRPIEVTLFSPEHLRSSHVIQHDAKRFALAIRSLLFLQQYRDPGKRLSLPGRVGQQDSSKKASVAERRHSPVMCNYLQAVRDRLALRDIRPTSIQKVLLDLAWENRDIRPDHLDYFRGVRVVPGKRWNRSNEWDNVLGYYDPEDRLIKLHEHLLSRPERLKEDLLIALGESLLGRYIENRRWIDLDAFNDCSAKCYEIRLRPVRERSCLLTDAQLTTFLRLARMVRDLRDPLVYRITLNNNEGFLPSGLLFGLMYAWYLNNSYGGVMEYEMSLLKWRPESLIPYQAQERIRKQALVRFFCNEVFGAH
jgi:uncharacterized cofD-like protein